MFRFTRKNHKTLPDAPFNWHYIELKVSGGSVKVVPLIFTGDIEAGDAPKSFIEILRVVFLAVEVAVDSIAPGFIYPF